MLTTFLRSAGDYTSNYWFNTIKTDVTQTTRLYGVTALSGGDIVATGYHYEDTPTHRTLVARLSRQGHVQWIKQPNQATTSTTARVINDGAGNIILFHDNLSRTFLQSWSDDGTTLNWQREQYKNDAAFWGAYALARDGSGNIYALVETDNFLGSLIYNPVLSKYNSSGTIQWTRRLVNGSLACYPYIVAVDSSGNSYVAGQADATPDFGFIAKYNSSGTLSAQRKLTSGANVNASGVAVDSSGNVFVLASSHLIKYNSSLTLQWQKNLGTGFSWLHITSDDRIIVANNASRFMEVASDGNSIVWQYEVAGTYNPTIFSIDVDEDRPAIVGAGYANSNKPFVCRLPMNADYLGTYGNYALVSTAYSLSAGTLTDAAGTLTSSTPTLTNATTATTIASGLTENEDRAVIRP